MHRGSSVISMVPSRFPVVLKALWKHESTLPENSDMLERPTTSQMTSVPKAFKWVSKGSYRETWQLRIKKVIMTGPRAVLLQNKNKQTKKLIPSFQGILLSSFPTGGGEARSGRDDYILPGEFGVR